MTSRTRINISLALYSGSWAHFSRLPLNASPEWLSWHPTNAMCISLLGFFWFFFKEMLSNSSNSFSNSPMLSPTLDTREGQISQLRSHVLKNVKRSMKKKKKEFLHAFRYSSANTFICSEEFVSLLRRWRGGSRLYWESCIYWPSFSTTLLPIKHYHGYLKLFREDQRWGYRGAEWGVCVAMPILLSTGELLVSSSQMWNRMTLCNFLPRSVQKTVDRVTSESLTFLLWMTNLLLVRATHSHKSASISQVLVHSWKNWMKKTEMRKAAIQPVLQFCCWWLKVPHLLVVKDIKEMSWANDSNSCHLHPSFIWRGLIPNRWLCA